jgi:Skp family chaperone for outer membrane proteins
MRYRHAIALTAILALCLAAAPAPTGTQDFGTAKVAVANPANIFTNMQETKDLKAKLEQDRKELEGQLQSRKQKVTDQQAARDLLKVDSPQYSQADAELLKLAIEFDTWSKIQQATLQGNQKQQMKLLFDKIVLACGEVAAAKGIDVVIADQRPDLPENLGNITVDQLRAAINQRNVLFANPKVDISNDVVAVLDAKYKSAGGGAASAAPAGGTAPAPAK